VFISVIREIRGMVLPFNFSDLFGNFGTLGNFPDPRSSASIRGKSLFPLQISVISVISGKVLLSRSRSPDLFPTSPLLFLRVSKGFAFQFRGSLANLALLAIFLIRAHPRKSR
jgi:hypothetical protein